MIVEFPTAGPVLFGTEDWNRINVWARGDDRVLETQCIYQLDDNPPHIAISNSENDFVSMVEWTNLSEGHHTYKVGYINEYSADLDWSTAYIGQFNISNTGNLTFAFGSCRNVVHVGPIKVFGTGKKADKIFESIKNVKDMDFFMSIGDQWYYDTSIPHARSVKAMGKMARKIYNYPHARYLHSSAKIRRMCDDHDFQKNNTCRKTRERDPKTARNGRRAYEIYQHYKGPINSRNLPLYYTFVEKNVHFFVMDTRSERDEIETKTMISEDQFFAFENWISDPIRKDCVKFVVTPTPFLSQNSPDSWFGFPKQQKDVIDLLLNQEHVIILTGDAHCCRTANYDIYDANRHLGNLTEIMSSGLCAVHHDVGKQCVNGIKTENYDRFNNFKYQLDNTDKGGYKFLTNYASETFPKNCPWYQQFSHLFERVTDDVFTRIIVNDRDIMITVINQYGDDLFNQCINV